MSRPRSIDDAQILEAARKLFLEGGARASTAAIAKAAGVSEGTIFKRFETKQHLFFAAMGLPRPIEASRLLAGRAGTGDVQTHLVEVSMEIIAFFGVMVPRMNLLCAHPAYDPKVVFADDSEPPPVRLVRGLAVWLDHEATSGRVRPGASEKVARVLLGALFNFVFWQVNGLDRGAESDPREYAEGVVDLLWRGLAPDGGPAEDNS